MRRRVEYRFPLLVLSLAYGCSIHRCPGSNPEQVLTDSGKIEGAGVDGVIAFKGIAYAAPPIGRLWWRPPQPRKKWSRVRSAIEYGADCMQLPFPSDAAPLGTPNFGNPDNTLTDQLFGNRRRHWRTV